ncbi:MAG: rhomboid family intramembrane serine protease [Calditrichaeota bacterium]|nr:MAG: rhomboid family intramembrane serine protease [Calditrichota bacterium]
MIPLKDDNPRIGTPVMNYILLALNVLVYVYEMTLSPGELEQFIRHFGAVPNDITSFRNLHSLFTAMFLHGGLMHVAGNMLYLYIFGDNVENSMGSLRYLLFYLLCGLGASVSHIVIEPSSTMPMVGASGALSGVLAAYLVTFPRARVLVLVPVFFFITTIRLPAFIMLGFWFLMQLTSGLASLGLNVSGGIAWFAHIGGFLVGILLVKVFRNPDFEQMRMVWWS